PRSAMVASPSRTLMRACARDTDWSCTRSCASAPRPMITSPDAGSGNSRDERGSKTRRDSPSLGAARASSGGAPTVVLSSWRGGVSCVVTDTFLDLRTLRELPASAALAGAKSLIPKGFIAARALQWGQGGGEHGSLQLHQGRGEERGLVAPWRGQ